MSLPRFSMQHRVVVLAFASLALAVGVIQVLTMPRRADPEFTVPVCQVITRWPGVETERVEQLVTHPLEEEINTLGSSPHTSFAAWSSKTASCQLCTATTPSTQALDMQCRATSSPTE